MAIEINLDVMMAKRKISSNELAAAIGITPANLSVLKTGKAKAIRFSTLERYARCCSVSPEIFCAIKAVEKMNEYYNYADNAEQCGNVPPVNVYDRADGQFVQPQRQLQGPPEAKKVYGIRDFIFAVMTVIIGFITLKLFFTEGEIFPFAEVIASGWYHVIVATLAVMAVIYIGKNRPLHNGRFSAV